MVGVEFEKLLIGFPVFSMALLGLPIQGMTILYFRRKPSLQITAFDLVLADTILATVLLTLSVVATYIAYLTWYPDKVPMLLTLALCSIFSINANFFVASCAVTIFLKYFYLKLGIGFMGLSDFQIRYAAFLAKLSLAFLYVLIDNFGPVQNEVLPFVLLTHGSADYEPVIYGGMGGGIALILILIATFVTQRKATALNQTSKEEIVLVKIMAYPTVISVIQFFAYSFIKRTNRDHTFVENLLLMWIFCCFTVIFPFGVISRNTRIKDFILTKLGLKKNSQTNQQTI